MISESKNGELVEGIKNDDSVSFKEVYQLYHRQLYIIALRYVKDDELARDAVQDIFLTLWRKRKELDSNLSVRNFLIVALRNHLLNMIRNRKRRILKRLSFYREQDKSTRNQTEDTVISAEYNKIVREGLMELPEGRRMIFRMRRFDGMSNSEVSESLGISIHTVKSQFYHATRFIRKYLKVHAHI